jgi:serine/threonine protein kinase
LGLPDRARYRELSPQTSGKTYFITPTLKRGSYGKVRLSLGTDGQICAIKQVRTKHSKPKSNRSGTGKPIPLTTSDASISQEIAVANIVDPFLAPSSRIIVNGDNYLVMPFVIGDGLEVANRLPSAVRQCVCRVMLQDVAIMLADNMHAKNILHGDMKPGNTLVHKESGTTHIADFGSAKFLAAGSSVDARLGISGTYTAPEKCTKMPYGLKSDVFEFGAGALTLILGYAGQTIRNPFVWIADKDGHVDLAAMRGVHQRFEAWLPTRLGPDRLLDKTKMTNPTSEFDPIFHRALTIDQHVTQYIAGRMLRTMPEQRAASSEVKQFFLSIHSARPDQTQVGREILQALPYDLDVERDIIALRRVLDYRMKQSPELALENQANPANQSQL